MHTRQTTLVPSNPPPIRLPDGQSLAVELRVSARAKRVALRLHPAMDHVELVVPVGASVDRALVFLTSRIGWIAAQFARMPVAVPFQPGAIIPILGQDRILKALGPGRGHHPPFAITPTHIEVTGAIDHLARRTKRGLAETAHGLLSQKCTHLAKQVERPLGRISIGDAKSRWGSCAASGNIKFSWRLIMAPKAVMDYVAAHEIAHLVELNHGPRFWRLVEDLHPTFAADRAWLHQHGARLLRYG